MEKLTPCQWLTKLSRSKLSLWQREKIRLLANHISGELYLASSTHPYKEKKGKRRSNNNERRDWEASREDGHLVLVLAMTYSLWPVGYFYFHILSLLLLLEHTMPKAVKTISELPHISWVPNQIHIGTYLPSLLFATSHSTQVLLN